MTYDPLISRGVSSSLPAASSYWHATHQPMAQPPLHKKISTDYLIIGGGYTGLSAAITLAQAKQDVTLLDANSLGFGCAGRNGGFILSGSGRLSLSAIKDKWGHTSCRDSNNDGIGNVDNAMVRVPVHAISSKINYQTNKDLNSTLLLTYRGQTRDYGGSDVSFIDQLIDEYFLADLTSSYKINEFYNLDFSIKNVFDKFYENAFLYSGTPRTISIGLNKKF